MAEGREPENYEQSSRLKALDGLRKTDIIEEIDNRRLGYEQEGDYDVKFQRADSDDGQEVVWFEKENGVGISDKPQRKWKDIDVSPAAKLYKADSDQDLLLNKSKMQRAYHRVRKNLHNKTLHLYTLSELII
ncbi:DgyrCDS13341 [Dimorphilus gyrociliatus]|uniref:DgyrCDS13341 n=1 Tax=Dimorphilus gyrociliatus TaxID=2664684 RepID=A0A7I8WAD3_9ANNE|nr:DgyrCDS13341 [Dimorphilus gyrociliatus]